MADWLNDRKLDRKALGVLTANWQAVEAWQDHLVDATAQVLNSIVADVAGEPPGEAQVGGCYQHVT